MSTDAALASAVVPQPSDPSLSEGKCIERVNMFGEALAKWLGDV
jgi:hypothetical protein